MNELVRQTLANMANTSKEEGPWLQIDPSNTVLVEQLKKLRDELVAADPDLGIHTPPERHFAQPGAQADLVVEALLASKGQPVYLWELTRSQPYEYGRHTWGGMTQACEAISKLEGVRVLKETA